MINYSTITNIPNHVKLDRTVKKDLLYKLALHFTQKELEAILAEREKKADPLKHWRWIGEGTEWTM